MCTKVSLFVGKLGRIVIKRDAAVHQCCRYLVNAFDVVVNINRLDNNAI